MPDREEHAALERAIDEITEIAADFGLDFYPMRYEICPSDIIYTFGAYGMPTRFSHWSFGKAFNRMRMQYELGLSKIYELVINNNPCYAFLLDGNSLVQNKLIVAHVLAHCDFFKNNARFARTNRNMVESMSAAAERIRQYELEHGVEEVEKFLDAVLAIQEHIDPVLHQPGGLDKNRYEEWRRKQAKERKARTPTRSPYEDLWILDEDEPKSDANEQDPGESRRLPPHPEKDLVWFVQEFSPVLEDWQRDVMSMLRDEMLYFWPQIETKIMNEGWATYWHQRIMRELPLTSEETIEYAKLNAAVVQPSRHTINPYYLGVKMFEDIEKRFGRERIFEVREMDSDISFIRNYMTKELVQDLDLYVFEKKGQDWEVTDKNWKNVRDQLVVSRVNGGYPYLEVTDGDWQRNGELYIVHRYEDVELDLKYVERTMPYLVRLWGKPVHLQTVVENKPILFTCDGQQTVRKAI